jgi:hypothetical protein
MCIDALERVNGSVISLDRVHVVVGHSPSEEAHREGRRHHHRHDPTNEHYLLFNRTRRLHGTAVTNKI